LTIVLVSTESLTAQVIQEINVDPYQNSNIPSLPIDTNLPKTNSNNSKPNTIYIEDNNNSPKINELQGDYTFSNQSLPPIPTLLEPYSPQQKSNTEQKESLNNTSSINLPTQNNQENKPLTINIINPSSSVNTIPNQEVINTRRSLKEVILQSQSQPSTINNKPSNQESVYQVLVRTSGIEQQNKVKALYPNAFMKTINGESFLQIGIFSQKSTVEKISSTIVTIGLKPVIIQK
jgi:hypothetical protein